jgi:hypothetical protein
MIVPQRQDKATIEKERKQKTHAQKTPELRKKEEKRRKRKKIPHELRDQESQYQS